MTLIAYQESQQISASYDWSFYSLVMAAMRKADDDNLAKLESVFPEVLAELRARHKAPGGALDEHELEIVLRQYEDANAGDEEEDDDEEEEEGEL